MLLRLRFQRLLLPEYGWLACILPTLLCVDGCGCGCGVHAGLSRARTRTRMWCLCLVTTTIQTDGGTASSAGTSTGSPRDGMTRPGRCSAKCAMGPACTGMLSQLKISMLWLKVCTEAQKHLIRCIQVSALSVQLPDTLPLSSNHHSSSPSILFAQIAENP